MRLFLCVLMLLNALNGLSQNYSSWFTGNPIDSIASPSGGICLMGGATEDDNAMRWFLQRANGGDVLVLRASGSNGYNDYLYAQLGVPVNSVETILCSNSAASYDSYVLSRIEKAEAIWFAGGNQWNYISYWRNTPVDSLINKAIRERNIAIGGTSAGMAIMGGFYFSAQNGSITSGAAMANPYASQLTIDSAAFLNNRFLEDVITDTHFDNPDRRGRLATFLARIRQDYGTEGKAIACEEYTAVCIDSGGTARVFGGSPASDDKAYFIQINCAINNNVPETCQAGNPLSWNQGGSALKVLVVPGTASGTLALNLKNWQAAPNLSWQDWSVSNGLFASANGSQPECNVLQAAETVPDEAIRFLPEPSRGRFRVKGQYSRNWKENLKVFDASGREIPILVKQMQENQIEIEMAAFRPGLHFIRILSGSSATTAAKLWFE